MGAGIVQILIKAKDLTAAAFTSTKAKLAAMKVGVGKAQTGWMTLGSKIKSTMSNALMPIMLVVAAVYAIGSAVGSVINSFSSFETAMKGVQKTTGMTDEEVVAIGDDFKEMSKIVPKSAEELAGIGRIAGQLGIQGAEDITSFTQTVAEASIAFDMDAESAALGLAALVKIYGKTIPEATNLGSAVNALGNTTGATEEQILTFGTSLGPTAEMLGFTAGEALGMGATLIELKIDASDAGTRINSALTMMGQKLPHVADLLGISEEAFKDAFGADPLQMLINIIDKVKEIEDPLDQNTKLTQIFGRIGAKAMRGLAKDTGRLTENVETATGAYEEGTAMHEEYLIFASSFASQMDMIENKVNLAAIAIGEKFAPAILALGTALTNTVIPGFAAFGAEIGTQTKETWPKFKTAVSEAFGKLVGDTNLLTWQNMMTVMGRGIGAVLNAILIGLTLLIEANGPFLTAIGAIVTCLVEFISDIKNLSVKEAFSNLKDNIFAGLGAILDSVADHVSPIVDAIITGLSTTTEKAKTIFGDVKEAIFTKLGSIKDDLGEKLGPVITAILDKFGAIKDGLAEKLDPVKTAVLTKLGEIKDELDPILNPLKTAIHDKLGAIKDGLAEKLAPVKTAIEGVFTSAVGIIETKFADLPTSIGTIFTTIGEAITAFGESLPDFLGTGITDMGEAFIDLGDAFTTPSEGIKADITDNIVTPLSTDVPAAAATASDAIGSELGEAEGYFDAATTTISTMKSNIETVPTSVETISDATGALEEDVKEDMDKVTLTVDGVEVSFEGLEGKVGDVVTEFGTFEDIAGDLIGLDWSVFTTLKEELPDIDEGIGDMQTAFEGLKKVLDDNIDNLASIEEDLGDIDKAITPFVNNIAPGITAVGNFADALSDTQNALSTFASMSEIDLEGMLGFEGAVHSMVMGLEILDGQMERLVPSFKDIKNLIGTVTDTFVWSGGRSETMSEQYSTAFTHIREDMAEVGISAEEFGEKLDELLIVRPEWEMHPDVALLDPTGGLLFQLGLASDGFKELFYVMEDIEGEEYDKHWGDISKAVRTAGWDSEKASDKMMHGSKAVTFQLDKQTGALKNQASELLKISDAIQPLLDFMGTLNELYESVFGEKAAVWDAIKVQEVFESIENTIRFFGETLNKVDFGKFVGEAVDSSEGFMTAMREQGSELNILTNYIDILLGYYVDLAELMGRLAEAEDDIGEEGFEVADAFAAINDYMQGLITYLPELTVGLSALNDIWSKNTDTISGSMTAFHEITGVIKAINLSYADFTETMIELSQAQETGIALGVDLSKGFEMIITFVDGLTGVIPQLATELNTLNGVWNQNNEVVNKGAIAFVNAMKPIQTVGGIMLDFSDVMVITGKDVSAGFDNIIDYVAELTDFTPRLALALSGLKTVWDENSGAIEVGLDAFSNIVGAISDVQTAIGDLVTSEGNLETAAGDAASAIDTESDALAGSSLTTSADAATGSSVQLTGATGELMGAISSLAGAIDGAAATFGGLVSAMSGALSVMNSLAGGAYSAGAAFGNSFADGIYSAMGSVEGAAGALADVVASYLEVHSNTKLGALRDLMGWGPNLVKAFVQGIRGELGNLSNVLNELKVGSLNKAVSGITLNGVNKVLNEISLGNVNMTSAMASGSGGGTKIVNLTFNQTISNSSDAAHIIAEVERIMKKPTLI